jgi:hypothetical protein
LAFWYAAIRKHKANAIVHSKGSTLGFLKMKGGKTKSGKPINADTL